MLRIAAGLTIMLTAVVLQLLMVIGLLTPDLALAFSGYGLLFFGMLVSLTGALQLVHRRTH